MTRKLGAHLRANVVGYLALFVALGGTGAYAAKSIVGSDGQINGCYKKVGRGQGTLRVVAEGSKCARGERKVVWSQKGPAGEPGPPGAPGAPGAPGQPGPPGSDNAYSRTDADARFLGAGAKAANAELLDELNSTDFARSSLFGPSGIEAGPGAGDNSAGSCYYGEIRLMASGNRSIPGFVPAHGQFLPINQNTALFSVILNRYGGNGQTNFRLPDLAAAEPKGTGPASPSYQICVQGVFPGVPP